MRILGYLIKDLRIVKKDILAHVLAYLIFPIAMSFFYGYFQDKIFKGTYQVEKFTIAIEDNDNSNSSRMLKTVFQDEQFRNTFSLDDKNPDITVIIPSGFEESLLEGSKSTIEINSLKENLAVQKHFVQGVIETFDKNQAMISGVVRSINSSELNQDEKNKLSREYTGKIINMVKKSSVNSEIIEANDKLDSIQYYSISVLTFVSIIMIMNFSREYVKERKDDTLRRIASISIDGKKLFIGKVLSFFIISLISIAVYVLFYRLTGKSFQGSWLMIAVAVVFNALFISAASGLIIALFKDERMITTAVTSMMILSTCIGGVFFPLDIIDNKFLNIASQFSPNVWVGNLYKKAMTQNDLVNMLPSIEMLAVVVLISFLIGSIKMNRRWEE